MLRKNLRTFIEKYDKLFVSVVALLPITLQPLSSKLGKVTLPSIWAIVLIMTCVTLNTNGYQKLALLGAIVIACIPIGSILKLFVRRSRPKTIYAQNMRIKSYSFPSSHAYAATIAGGYLALVCLTIFPSPFNGLAATAYFAMIIAIGISRVHVGAHYPTDVTAGWLLGATVLSIIMQLNL